MIAILLLLPLVIAIGATVALLRGPVPSRPRFVIGLLCFGLAALLQTFASSLPSWPDGWPTLQGAATWLLRSLDIDLNAPYTLYFLRPARLVPWLVNVMALTLLALLVWPICCVAYRGKRDRDIAFLSHWFRGRPLRIFYRDTLGVVWLVVVLCVYGRPFLAMMDQNWLEFVSAPLDGIFWFGPLALTALVAGAARPIDIAPLITDDAEEAPVRNRPDIGALLTHIERTYRDKDLAWMGHVDLSGNEPAPEPGHGGDEVVTRALERLNAQVEIPADARPRVRSALTQGFANFWGDTPVAAGKPPWEPWNVLISEELARSHLAVIVETIQSCHDHGGIVLVIAPPWTLGRVRRAMEAAGKEDWSDITQRWGDLTEKSLDPTEQYNVIFASDELLEAGLLARQRIDPGVRRILTMLRLVVVFDFHLLEAAMLRLRLRRLRWLTQSQTIRVICQSEYRESLLTAVGSTFAPLTSGPFNMIELAVNLSRQRHLVVWNNDLTTLRALFKQEHGGAMVRPVEIAPLLARMARRNPWRVEPAFIDSSGRWDKAVWDRVLPNFISDSINMFPRRDVLCMIADDRGNLIDAVLQHRNYHGAGEYVLMVVSRRYALRDWFLFLLKENDSQLSPLRPIAPDPHGGLTEIAMILAAEFQDARSAVPQSKIVDLFGEAKPATIETFGLFPTQAGLDRLFLRVNGPGQGLKVEPSQDRRHDIHFSRPSDGPEPRPPLLSLPVEAAPRMHLSPGDHGLQYASGTMLHDNGQVYVVGDVDIERQQTIKATHSEAARPSRATHIFHRQYALMFAPGQVALEAGGRPRSVVDGITHRRATLRGEFHRLTGAIAALDETSTQPIHGQWQTTDIRTAARHAAMLLWRLELSGPQVTSNLLGRPDRMAQTAFTMAATLQDVLGSLFPTHAHRVAVVSPRAGPCVAAALQAADGSATAQIERFPIDYYPRIVAELPRRSANPRNHLAADPEPLEQAITSLLGDAADPDMLEGPRQILDLLILEDSDHDLGVVRALDNDQTWSKVVDAWSRFTYWMGESDGATDPSRTAFYRFGGTALASCFAFPDAAGAVQSFGVGNSWSDRT